MQRKVTMALATFWLVFVAIVGTNSSQPLHLTFDQYSPPKPPSQQRVNYTDNVSSQATHRKDTTSKDPSIDPTNIFKLIFANRGSRQQQLEEQYQPFDSFKYEDDNPGSIGIYKLDLFEGKKGNESSTSSNDIHSKHVSNKSELKFETVKHKENNFIEDSGNLDHIQDGSLKVPNNEIFTVNDHYSLENLFPPSTNKDEARDRPVETWNGQELFETGTVPELQVGCEGVVESSSRKNKRSPMVVNNWLYEFDSENDEDLGGEIIPMIVESKERDEGKKRRSDIEVPGYYDDYDTKETSWIWDKLPIRGDLGMNAEGWELRRKILERRNRTYDNFIESETDIEDQGRFKRSLQRYENPRGIDEPRNTGYQIDRQTRRNNWPGRERKMNDHEGLYQEQTRSRSEDNWPPEENTKQQQQQQRAMKGNFNRSLNDHLYRQRVEQELRNRGEENRRKHKPEEDSEHLEKRRQEWLIKKQRQQVDPTVVSPPSATSLSDVQENQIYRENKRQEQEALRNNRGREQTRPSVHRHRDDPQNRNSNEDENRMKLENYIRRNNPIRVPNRSNHPSDTEEMPNPRDERRRHGGTNFNTRSGFDRSTPIEETRRREMERQREDEARRYENNRRRQEEMRRIDERNRRRETNSRRIYDHTPNWDRVMAQRRGPEITYPGPTHVDRHTSDERNRQGSRVDIVDTNRGMDDQRRREEDIRLNSLPVKARIILQHSDGSSTRPANGTQPVVVPRTGFGDEIDFPNLDPHRRGIEVARFPAPATLRPPVRSPRSCNFAILQCCLWNKSRLVRCFESLKCPGVNWDSNPCSHDKIEAAKAEVGNFYHPDRSDDH